MQIDVGNILVGIGTIKSNTTPTKKKKKKKKITNFFHRYPEHSGVPPLHPSKRNVKKLPINILIILATIIIAPRLNTLGKSALGIALIIYAITLLAPRKDR
ncbi:hypothetical protein [Arcanobacterium canis]